MRASKTSKSKGKPPLPANFPQHNLPEPFAQLQMLGDSEPEAVYLEIATTLLNGDVAAGVAQLQAMALDETYYDYWEFYKNEDDYYRYEPRMWTTVHAVRVLMHLGAAAAPAIEPLLPLLDEEADDLREEMPFFYAAMGRPAIAPLTRLLNDTEKDAMLRVGASDSLAEIGEKHPDLRAEIVQIQERIVSEEQDPTVVAFAISNLLDLGARESMPLIEQAFQEDRVDDTVVELYDVQEHFDLPRTAKPRRLEMMLESLAAPSDDYYEDDEIEAGEETPQTPYVALVKAGRNDPCPCGSGKKYKKCCGA